MRIILSILLSLLLVGGAGAPSVISSAIVVAAERQETHLLIQDYLQRSYLELFELEADQLGVQYAWNAGYDTSGFIRFFDHMATTRGYVDGSSFFRTHPPFYERMVKTQREIMFLPTQDDPVTSSAEFAAMKAELEKMVTLAGEAEEHDAARPSDPVERCGTPDTVGYQPDPTIEALCASIN